MLRRVVTLAAENAAFRSISETNPSGIWQKAGEIAVDDCARWSASVSAPQESDESIPSYPSPSGMGNLHEEAGRTWLLPGLSGLLGSVFDSLLLAVPKWKQSQWKRRFKMHKQWLSPVKKVALCPKCMRVMGPHEVPYDCKDKIACPSMGLGKWPPPFLASLKIRTPEK